MPEYTELALIRAIEGRLAHLDSAVRGLYQHLGLDYPERSPGVPADVIEALEAGDKIAAVNRYREHTGVGIKEAKRAIDAIENGESPS